MGIHHNSTGLRLPENAGETNDRHHVGKDDVTQHVARADARQLVGVADHDETHVGRNGFDEEIHQHQVNHGAFVHDEHVAFQRIVRIAVAALLRIIFQQAVNRLCLLPRCLAHSLGSTPGRSGEQDAQFRCFQRGDDGSRRGGLSCARSAGQHHDL